MINVFVKCPHCGKSLMNLKHRIDSKPSVAITLTYAGKNAPLYLSSLYGSFNVFTDINVPFGKVAGFRCPLCKSDLKSTRKCDMCGAQMVAFDLKDGGQVQICSRRGCKKHIIEFQDPDSELKAFYKSYLKAFQSR
jgi:ssDNA-binding Zn-finger/Zn-ribbon topoisomerase 1